MKLIDAENENQSGIASAFFGKSKKNYLKIQRCSSVSIVVFIIFQQNYQNGKKCSKIVVQHLLMRPVCSNEPAKVIKRKTAGHFQ